MCDTLNKVFFVIIMILLIAMLITTNKLSYRTKEKDEWIESYTKMVTERNQFNTERHNYAKLSEKHKKEAEFFRSKLISHGVGEWGFSDSGEVIFKVK